MLKFLLCLLLFFAVYFAGSFWANLVPQGSAQYIPWAIAGGISFIVLLIVFGFVYWLCEEVFFLFDVGKWWYWGSSILLAFAFGLFITPRLMYPVIAGYMGHPSGVSTNNFWGDVGWILGGIGHGIAWAAVGVWNGLVWLFGGIGHGIVWAAVGVWNGLVWLFGWVGALIAAIMTLIIIPSVVADAVGNQRIRPFSGVYHFLQDVRILKAPEENKSPTTPPTSTSHPLLEPLSERESEVLRLIIAGFSNREIADQLAIPVSTVKWYVNAIYGKLQVDSRKKAIAWARELHLV